MVTYRSSSSPGEDKAITVRLSKPVYEAASVAARANHVSLNSFIETAVASYAVNNSTQTLSALTSSAAAFASQAADSIQGALNTVNDYQAALDALSGKKAP